MLSLKLDQKSVMIENKFVEKVIFVFSGIFKMKTNISNLSTDIAKRFITLALLAM